MPVLFIGHGSPMNIIGDNSFTRSLATWGKQLPKPDAIMVISAHWLTSGTAAGCMERPRTIHDFYGFPAELYSMNYPCPGSPRDAALAAKAITRTRARCEDTWGLDHGAWSILLHLFPLADIPVFQLSLDYSYRDPNPKPLSYHFELALELRALREKGILIIGSGNIVHNLGMLDFENEDAKPFDWAVEFDERVKANLVSGNHEGLMRLTSMGETASLAVPTLDHYLPMIYTIALQGKDERLVFTHEGFQHGSISMRCFQIG